MTLPVAAASFASVVLRSNQDDPEQLLAAVNFGRQIRIVVPPDLPGVRVFHLRNSTQMLSHYNEAYSIATIFTCASEISYRGKRYRASPGAVALMDPDGIFRHLSNPVGETISKVHVVPEVFEQTVAELGFRGGSPRFKRVALHSPTLFCAFTDLHRCLDADATPLEQQSRFAECVQMLIDQAIDHAPLSAQLGLERRAVRVVRELLHHRFAERVTLRELCDATGLSTYRLVRVFSRDMGLPPHAYQNRLRLARARELLASGMPASEVAFEVGFVDQSHLIRHFRRTAGYTPALFTRGTGSHAVTSDASRPAPGPTRHADRPRR